MIPDHPTLILVPSAIEECVILSMRCGRPFATLEFKRIFNAYADNIYYSSGSAEANVYLLGGATPSSRQTNQYLLRNEALKQIGELVDELVFQQKQPATERDVSVAQEYMDNALTVFSEYLALAPPEELQIAQGQGSVLKRER